MSFVFNSLTLSDKKSLKQISRTSLCGFNRVAVDMEPPKGDNSFQLQLWTAVGKKQTIHACEQDLQSTMCRYANLEEENNLEYKVQH